MFYITISNGLLKDGHRKRMGSSVWEFMWLMDKVTKIDNEGIGWVLGGKPIKLQEMAKDMDMRESTISENLTKLEDEGYIKKITTPYGLSLRIIKAKKRFGKTETSNEGIRKTANLSSENRKPHSENRKPNKTVSVDNNSKTLLAGETPAEDSKEISFLINLFKGVSPNTYSDFFGNTTERSACSKLIKRFPRDELEFVITKALPTMNVMAYVGKDSKAFKPSELLRNADKIVAKIKELQNKQKGQKHKTSPIIQ